MVAANSYENILKYLAYGPRTAAWMCGLLFAPPKSPIGESILDRLDDWHHRSGEDFDFFCVGYVEVAEFPDDEPVGRLTELDGRGSRQWYFSPRAFHDIRRTIEEHSDWKYSEEADLLLVNAVRVAANPDEPILAFNEMIALDIDKLIREGVYPSAARLMGQVCRAAEESAREGRHIDVLEFSDDQFARTLFKRTLGAVAKKLKLDVPLGARHFLVGAHHLEPA